jgi:hypothetical protein
MNHGEDTSTGVFLPCHKGSGAPSFALFAKGGKSRSCGKGPRAKSSGIPPFANSAKDGAPDPLRQGKKYGFRLSRLPG